MLASSRRPCPRWWRCWVWLSWGIGCRGCSWGLSGLPWRGGGRGGAPGGRGGVTPVVGNLVVGAAVLCEASFVVLGKRLAPPYRPLRLSLGANLAGLVLSLPLAVAARPGFDIGGVRPGMCLLVTCYSLSSGVICLWLWYRGLPYVETWLAGLATAAIPVVA